MLCCFCFCFPRFLFTKRWSDGMRCCKSDWSGLCLFCCYNPHVLSANKLIWAFLFKNFVLLPPSHLALLQIFFLEISFVLPPSPQFLDDIDQEVQAMGHKLTKVSLACEGWNFGEIKMNGALSKIFFEKLSRNSIFFGTVGKPWRCVVLRCCGSHNADHEVTFATGADNFKEAFALPISSISQANTMVCPLLCSTVLFASLTLLQGKTDTIIQFDRDSTAKESVSGGLHFSFIKYQ